MIFLLVVLDCIYDTASRGGRSGWGHVAAAGIGYGLFACLGGGSVLLSWIWVGAVYLFAERGLPGDAGAQQQRWRCPACRWFHPPTTLVCPCGTERPDRPEEYRGGEDEAVAVPEGTVVPKHRVRVTDDGIGSTAAWAVPGRIRLIFERPASKPTWQKRLDIVSAGASMAAAVFLVVLFQLIFILGLTASTTGSTSGVAMIVPQSAVQLRDIESFRAGEPLQVRYHREQPDPARDRVVAVEVLAGGRVRCDGELVAVPASPAAEPVPGPCNPTTAGMVLYVLFLQKETQYSEVVATIDWLTRLDHERTTVDDLLKRYRVPPVFLGTTESEG